MVSLRGLVGGSDTFPGENGCGPGCSAMPAVDLSDASLDTYKGSGVEVCVSDGPANDVCAVAYRAAASPPEVLYIGSQHDVSGFEPCSGAEDEPDLCRCRTVLECL